MIGLDVERFENVPVARPRGDIDAANAQAIQEELTACIAADTDRLVVDLTDTRYVDSAGLDMLFRLNDRLSQRRARLLLVIPRSSPLIRLAEIVGLALAMPVHDTVEQALEACSAETGSAETGAEALERD